MIKGSLLLSAPIVKRFRSQKTCPVLGKIWRFWAINRGLKFKFYNPKKAYPCVISSLLRYRA